MKLSELEKTKTWVIGVSGGGDSMALLHMCIREHMSVIVAHMNYQKRASAQRDTEGVRRFCKQYHIPLEIRYQEEPCTENFQSFARKKRYAFYREVAQQYHAAGVLVAHQLDDHLETYLMQKAKGCVPMVYGLCDHADIAECHVVRPLLSYTKSELEMYCQKHHVPFWLDESNLSDVYMRNRIRHDVIDHMSRQEKEQMASEIAEKNRIHRQYNEAAQRFIDRWNGDCTSFLRLPDILAQYVLHRWIYAVCQCTISEKEAHTIQRMIAQNKHWTRQCSHAYDLHKEYGKLFILPHSSDTYAYTLHTIESITTPYFTIRDHGKTIEGVTLNAQDFPITIRPYQQGDAIRLRFGTKKLHRWFIDRKIPKAERKMWPVMVNKAGNIIFVPKIGCDIAHFSNNPNTFVIK